MKFVQCLLIKWRKLKIKALLAEPAECYSKKSSSVNRTGLNHCGVIRCLEAISLPLVFDTICIK